MTLCTYVCGSKFHFVEGKTMVEKDNLLYFKKNKGEKCSKV